MLFLSRVSKKVRIPQKEIGMDMYALEAEVREILGQECVAVSTDTSSGSGFLWLSEDDKELWVITSGHLLNGSQNGEVEFWSGQKAEFSVKDVEVYPEIDTAVIHMAALKKNVKTVLYEPNLQMQIGDSVWLLDSMYGPGSDIQSGMVYGVNLYLEDYGREMLLLSGNGAAGMSGCPIYDENGRVVAMMSGINEDGTILAAGPMDAIVKYLSK